MLGTAMTAFGVGFGLVNGLGVGLVFTNQISMPAAEKFCDFLDFSVCSGMEALGLLEPIEKIDHDVRAFKKGKKAKRDERFKIA